MEKLSCNEFWLYLLKVKVTVNCRTLAAYTSRFTIPEVAADWHELMAQQCIFQPSTGHAHRQLDQSLLSTEQLQQSTARTLHMLVVDVYDVYFRSFTVNNCIKNSQ